MSLPTDADISTIRLPDQITDRATQNKLVDFALTIDNMRRKLHAGLTNLGNVEITWNCGINQNYKGTVINGHQLLKSGNVILLPGPQFLNLLIKVDNYWKSNENARQKLDTKRKKFNWNDLGDMASKDSTYSLTSSTDTVTSGDSFTITVNAGNVNNGVKVGYNVTGVTSAMINGATKYSSVEIGGDQTIEYTTIADEISENNTFTFTLAPADTIGTLTDSPSLSVTINQAISSYTIESSLTTVPYFTNFTITISADPVVIGSTIGYTINGVTPSFIGATSDQGIVIFTTADQTLNYINNIVSNDISFSITLDATDSLGNVTGSPSFDITLLAPLLSP